jgi:L-seryl-tRNA(Ser) seleniumtransferase
VGTDRRRLVPRTDAVLADPRLVAAAQRLGPATVKRVVVEVLEAVRRGDATPESAADLAVAALPQEATTLRRVLNATGVVLHTNLGRAPLSAAAASAVQLAGGYVDVEYDAASGARASRGRGALDALTGAVPDAESVHVVNNGAAALVLAATALAADRDIVVSRGELVEIGDGFRLPDVLTATGARLVEVGTTNRTVLGDYRAAVDGRTGFVLKVHPSNFVVTGFTSSVSVSELTALEVPVVADIGSGLLHPHPLLPDEPDVTTTLRAGADLVIASGDKLFGGPQAGLLFGKRDLVETLRRHPLARALRVDKLTLAALEATARDPRTPVDAALRADVDDLERRCRALADDIAAAGVEVGVVPSNGVVGGGGAPGVELAGCAVALPESYAAALRLGQPCVVGRIEDGRCLLDLRCIPPEADAEVGKAVISV